MKPVFKTPDKNHILSAPPCIQLELSTGCNQKCIHCYNFWRSDDFKPANMTREQLDYLLDEFIKYKVLHVILSGGEHFLNFNNLEYPIEKVTYARISVSVNSNLTLATPDKIEKLRKAGLPHILTSLDACDEATNAYITSSPGSFEKAIQGIKATLDVGIRVSINMVVSHHNLDQIYKTAQLASDLGCQKFNVTRTVPIAPKDSSRRAEFEIGAEEARRMLDISLAIERDFNFETVGTMVPYPYCYLEDLEKYKLVLDKCSCVAGTKMMAINVDGNVHACVHESKSYGNVFNDGLIRAWQSLRDWHEGIFFPDDCKACAYFDLCVAGCRMAARAYNTLDGNDNLKVGAKRISKAIPTKPTQEMYASIEKDRFIVPPSLRFRKESSFYYVTTFGAKGVIVENDTAEFLKLRQKLQQSFTLEDVGVTCKKMLAFCLFFELIEKADNIEAREKKARIAEFVDK